MQHRFWSVPLSRAWTPEEWEAAHNPQATPTAAAAAAALHAFANDAAAATSDAGALGTAANDAGAFAAANDGTAADTAALHTSAIDAAAGPHQTAANGSSNAVQIEALAEAPSNNALCSLASFDAATALAGLHSSLSMDAAMTLAALSAAEMSAMSSAEAAGGRPERQSKAAAWKEKLRHCRHTERERITFGKSGIHGWGLFAKADMRQVRIVCALSFVIKRT